MATGLHATLLIPVRRPWRRDRDGRATAFAWSMLGRTLWAHKLFLACLVLSVLALTSLHVSQVPPVFEAETLVLLGERKGASEAIASLAAPRQEGPEGEALAFRSPALAEGLVDALSLHLLPEFNPALRTEAAGLRDWFDPGRGWSRLAVQSPAGGTARGPLGAGGALGPAAGGLASRRGRGAGAGAYRRRARRPAVRDPRAVLLHRSQARGPGR